VVALTTTYEPWKHLKLWVPSHWIAPRLITQPGSLKIRLTLPNSNALPTMQQYLNEYQAVGQVLADLKAIVQRENERHEMDQHLTYSTLSLLEEEIIPLIQAELDYDPTPQYSEHLAGI